MTRSLTRLSVAAVGFAVSLGAQTPTSTTNQRPAASPAAGHDVSVTGCLAKAADGRFMLTSAMVDPTPSAATTTAGAPSATGAPATTTTPTATAPSGTTSATTTPAMTWMLSGGTDLDKHLGHKIQVMGRTTWDASMAGTSMPGAATGTTGVTTPPTTAGGTPTGAGAMTRPTTTTDEQRMSANRPLVNVQTVKMLSASCS
jgi:hypothetical protein